MTPAILETTKALAGIANAERISDKNKEKANEYLGKLLDIIGKDVDTYHQEEMSKIIKPLTQGLA